MSELEPDNPSARYKAIHWASGGFALGFGTPLKDAYVESAGDLGLILGISLLIACVYAIAAVVLSLFVKSKPKELKANLMLAFGLTLLITAIFKAGDPSGFTLLPPAIYVLWLRMRKRSRPA